MTIRIEVRNKSGAQQQSVVQNATALGINGVTGCQLVRLYFLSQNPGDEAVERLRMLLLADPVTDVAIWREIESNQLSVTSEQSAVKESGSLADTDNWLLNTAHWLVEVAPRP